MKTKSQIIDETLEAYLPEARGERKVRSFIDGEDGRGCAILSKNGNMCAVGRCMTPESRALFWEDTGPVLGKWAPVPNILDKYLQPEYQGHETEFWDSIQKFHDDNEIWVSEEYANRAAAHLHMIWDSK